MKKQKIETLDLHGMRHEDVDRVLIRKIEELWNSGETLVIVTGNSMKMKEIVKCILEEYKLSCEDGDAYNNGYIKTTV